MSDCIDGFNQQKQNINLANIEYDKWAQNQFVKLEEILHKIIKIHDKPLALVLEIGHFSPLFSKKELLWSKRNIDFAEELCSKVIKRYQKLIRIIPTILVNNLDEEDQHLTKTILHDMLKNKKFITYKSVKVLLERNLKNRAYKALKNDPTLSNSFINIDGKAYLKYDEYQNDLAAGFMDEDGRIIPRCGLILTSYIDKIILLSKQRLNRLKDINIVFVSFSKEYHEYKRVRLGVDIYTQTRSEIYLSPIVTHWNYEIDSFLVAYREYNIKKWVSV